MLFVLLALMSVVVGVRSDCTFATSTSSYDLSPLTQTSGTDYKVSNNGIGMFLFAPTHLMQSHAHWFNVIRLLLQLMLSCPHITRLRHLRPRRPLCSERGAMPQLGAAQRRRPGRQTGRGHR